MSKRSLDRDNVQPLATEQSEEHPILEKRKGYFSSAMAIKRLQHQPKRKPGENNPGKPHIKKKKGVSHTLGNTVVSASLSINRQLIRRDTIRCCHILDDCLVAIRASHLPQPLFEISITDRRLYT
jgi:hypothetical protein